MFRPTIWKPEGCKQIVFVDTTRDPERRYTTPPGSTNESSIWRYRLCWTSFRRRHLRKPCSRRGVFLSRTFADWHPEGFFRDLGCVCLRARVVWPSPWASVRFFPHTSLRRGIWIDKQFYFSEGWGWSPWSWSSWEVWWYNWFVPQRRRNML